MNSICCINCAISPQAYSTAFFNSLTYKEINNIQKVSLKSYSFEKCKKNEKQPNTLTVPFALQARNIFQTKTGI